MDFNGTVYKILLVLHILAVVTAFGPLFLYSSLQQAGNTVQIARIHMRMSFPALLVLFVVGMGMVGMSEGLYDVGQAWIALALVIWAVLLVVSWFMIRPALRDDSQKASGRLGAGIGITHLGMVVGLILMVFRPGL